MSLFKKGYGVVREVKQQQEKEAEKRKSGLYRMFIKEDGGEAVMRFLTEEPITFYEHTIPRRGKYDSIPCIGDGCPVCEDGDRPRFVGAFLVVDCREYEYKDSTGKTKKGKNQIRLFVQGTKVLSQLDRLSEKYGLTNRDYTIVRTGLGTSTTYSFEREEESGKLSKKEIENLLPEPLKPLYDGTMESLYALVEKQIMMSVEGGEDEEEDEIPFDDNKKKTVSLDEEDEKPKAKKGLKSLMKK